MTPKFFKHVAAFSALGFAIVFPLWPALWVPNRFALLLSLIASLPLWIALPGLFRGKVYTHAWTTLLSTMYVAYCAMEAYANAPARDPALISGILAALWFVASNLYVRGMRGREPDQGSA